MSSDRPSARRKREAASIPDLVNPPSWLANATRTFAGTALRLSQKLHVEGLDNVPASGPAIIAPNHLSESDSVVLMGVLPRPIRFIGKAEYMEDWTTRLGFQMMGNIPVDRSDPESGRIALDLAAKVLERGGLFGIYPEGTRSRDGLLHRGKTGVARLAIRTGAPVVPVGLIGTDDMQPIDGLPRVGTEVTVRFGPPIDPSIYADRPDQTLAPRQMTDDLMFEIRELSGQEYVDEYMRRADEIDKAS